MGQLRCNPFLLLLVSLALIFPAQSKAQEQRSDSFYYSTDSSIDFEASATSIEGEYIETEPESPAVYNSAAPTQSQWRQLTSHDAYSYRDKLEYVPKKEMPEKQSGFARLLLHLFAFLASGAGQVLLWSVFLGIIIFIAFKVFAGQGTWLFAPKDRKLAEDVEAEVTEQNLLEQNWESLLQNAIKEGDVRLTIRYSYLRLLQILQEHDLIVYSPEKTNNDYFKELSDRPQRQSFRTLARQYEYAWYGNYLPAAADLDAYLSTYRQLKQSLGTA